ncbi:MAG: cell division protein ZapA [Desulfobulbaceae bacterium]|jgi:cell division protein ZapA (FtsZ GTPase activity inhibitor)|nr:cell division protein ZapA [Desulfobulbaceae bacterium]
MERLVKFEVLGQEYPLYTDAREEDVQEILNLVRSFLEQTGHSSSLPVNKLAILTSLNMAGKYVKLKRDFDEYKLQINNEVDLLHHKINQAL